MHSENGLLIDFDEIGKLVADADVFAVGFGAFVERLLIDSRANDIETSLIQVVQPKGSAQERVRWLNRRRPSLGPPRTFSFIAWPHSIAFLVESGVWDTLRNKVGAADDPHVEAQCNLALARLQELDHAASLALIKGEHSTTLWPQR
jgi:hypothetical protein